MTLTVQIDDACELLEQLEGLKRSVDGLYDVWNALTETCNESLGDRISHRPDEPSLYY